MDIIVCIVLAYLNGMLAKRKGQNTFIWGLITVVAFFAAYIIGALITVSLFFNGTLDQESLRAFFTENVVRALSLLMSGIGGYLLIRYILSRMQDMPDRNV